VKQFAELLDRLAYTPSRNDKLRLLADYFAATPDPDRGWALAALTDGLFFRLPLRRILGEMIEARIDPVLFGLSRDYVGDTAETIALIWPGADASVQTPRLDDIVQELKRAMPSEVPGLLSNWLDGLDATERWALLKLLTGALRVGVSARLAKTALAEWSKVPLTEIEEVWHGLRPPYAALFAWLSGAGPRPETGTMATFRPLMLSHQIEDRELALIEPKDFVAEWKWDGIRVQAAHQGGERRLFSRTGDDISAAFPDVVAGLPPGVVLDGELLVMRGSEVAPFNDLQQRLNRKTVTASLLAEFPARLRAYDLLVDGEEDLRERPFAERRARLEQFIARLREPCIDLSPLVPFANWDDLAAARKNPAAAGAGPDAEAVEGVMLKRRDAPYLPGRPRGLWWKWKRDPFIVDTVLMYAQRGHGKRSSYYSDYTFGVWTRGEDGDLLVPVGKAYFGFTDEELVQLDRFVRRNTVARFGPVREVVHAAGQGLVLEVAFEGLQRSTRHKSGLAMRFPRINRLRWDKPPGEADRVETLERMLEKIETERGVSRALRNRTTRQDMP
jgi:DNA ligase-1